MQTPCMLFVGRVALRLARLAIIVQCLRKCVTGCTAARSGALKLLVYLPTKRGSQPTGETNSVGC